VLKYLAGKSQEIEIMGNRELEKKDSLMKSSPSRKSSDKSEEKISEATSTKIVDQSGESVADKPTDSHIFQKVKF